MDNVGSGSVKVFTFGSQGLISMPERVLAGNAAEWVETPFMATIIVSLNQGCGSGYFSNASTSTNKKRKNDR